MVKTEEAFAAPVATTLYEIAPTGDFSLALHGGAGGLIEELETYGKASFEDALSAAYDAGRTALEAGGSALDAVCAAVRQMEDDPLFNAGRGAALTAEGAAELDASVMDGAGRAGAVAASRSAKNPVLLARAVMERSPVLLLVAPSAELVAEWALQTESPEYFLTEARQAQLARVRAGAHGPRHGTVGAVARDSSGGLAAATSTGGRVNQWTGRVGDTPIIGAGSYARNGLGAVSCTGDGESFVRGVVSYDIVARMRYLECGLAEAVTATIANELTAKGASGGLVSVDHSGRVVVAHNSPALFAAFEDNGNLVTVT
jgi:beta-aspartyl-peptidase (threonine type)